MTDPLARHICSGAQEWDLDKRDADLSDEMAKRGILIFYEKHFNDPDFIKQARENHVATIRKRAAEKERVANGKHEQT